MSTFLLVLLSIALVLISLFGILVVLMQRPSESSGFGSSLGASAMDSAFGGEASSVLVRATVKCIVLFFIVSMALSLVYIARVNQQKHALSDQLPAVSTFEVNSTNEEATSTQPAKADSEKSDVSAPDYTE